MDRPFKILENNYIYLYHTQKFVILPTFPESITETLSSSFASTTPLARTAPIYTYSNSGPRSMTISLTLHRDMMQQVNYGFSNLDVAIGDDYVDTIIKELQAVALPRYSSPERLVDPPMVAVRLGNDIFIKGIVNGGITTTKSGPMMEDGKYAVCGLQFTVYEITPYDADEVVKYGSFRGLNKTLEKNSIKKK